MITITHAETVTYYPEQFSEPCRIVATGWPYDCEAKRANPGHDVFTCEPHRVWWHRAPGQAHDFRAVPDAKYPHLHNPQCSCGWHASGYVKLWLAIEKHRQHAGQPSISESWCPIPAPAGLAEYADQRGHDVDWMTAAQREKAAATA